ncbi:DUF6946 family protein [Bacillus litorisediminis]|uniref:DUF6946 family protein n=1 Tax=Bacillus litorisediminis TaxID=2922713 RepID=UPI0036F44F20
MVRVKAKNVLMLVHFFSHEGKGFEDYAQFVEFFNMASKKDSLVGKVVVIYMCNRKK